MAPPTQLVNPEPVAPSVDTGRLWVDKYKPRKYIDLLSDEMTNRSLLYWLKMWDKVVFGKVFHSKQEQQTANTGVAASQQLNSFNKRTGKFESNGGWRQRKARQALNTNVDELGRPMQKVALLCGPPGLGKTTLAHTIARHAGYNVREINASDDRSPEAFKLALENGTQMSSVLNEDKRPNCIVLGKKRLLLPQSKFVILFSIQMRLTAHRVSPLSIWSNSSAMASSARPSPKAPRRSTMCCVVPSSAFATTSMIPPCDHCVKLHS